VKFSFRQILASAGGAVLAALIASAFGVKGTIVGVAIGSAAATILRDTSEWHWNRSMSAMAREGSRSFQSASDSGSPGIGLADFVSANTCSNQDHSTSVMCRTMPSRLSGDGGTPRRARSSPSSSSHFHSSVERW